MGFLDRLFGTDRDEEYRRTTEQVKQASSARSDDEIAVERYRYLLRTAPPETIEAAHEEAFSKLTPQQRALLFTQLSADAPTGDAPTADTPRALAVSATRAELRQPGTMERALGGSNNGGPGFGSMFASSLMGSVAGYFIASSLMSAFMPMDMGGDNSGGADAETDAGADSSDDFISADGGGGFGGGDVGGDFGGGFGDFGDFGF